MLKSVEHIFLASWRLGARSDLISDAEKRWEQYSLLVAFYSLLVARCSWFDIWCWKALGSL